MPCDGPASCSGRGTCDLTRGVCECPLSFTGAHCEVATLPACVLGGHLIPIRAWVLHALEGGAGRTRWSGTPRAIGPVPCRCLLQLVSQPFVLRRSELANLRDDPLVRCVHLPPRLTLARYLAAPDRAQIVWRTFSFAAAHAALKSGAVPALKSGDHPTLGAGEPPALALLPLARCGAAGCGGRGWCEPSAGGAAPRCGCFVAGGLAANVGGASCDDPKVWRAHRQPAPHADFQPRCPQDCLRRGDCDWQGFCRCRRGFWGLDCALTRGADGAPVVDLPDAPRRPEAAAAAPRVYVLDMPPLLRFGNPFAPHFGAKLELRFLRGAQRAADPRTAEYVFLPGVPLVVDGHRLLARLWHARQHWPMWNASRAARHALLLLTERAQYDALQLSSNADDRETWPPALMARAPHAAGILAISSSRCGSLDDRMMPWKASRRRCELGAEFEPASPTRRWLGLQFTGNRDPASKFTAFVRGVDIVLPQLLLIRRGGSHADQPSCDQMARTSPFSPAFDRHARHRNRSTLLWFGGHPGIASTARSRLIAAYASRPGYVLRDTRDPSRRIDATNMSLSSAFCWVPRGQGEGDPTRHMIAIFHGCVPVFSLGVASADDALPFDEVLPWDAFSLRVPTDRLGRLPAALRAAAAPARLAQRQAALACAWRALYWSSIEGSCFGEAGDDGGDAFGTLLAVLASRLRGAAQPPSNACDGVDLPEHLEAQGHPGRPARWLAPGSTFTQSG